MRKERIFSEALGLPDAARAELADKLTSSLAPPDQAEIDAAWAREAESRIAAFERGEIEAIPGEQVFAAIEARRRS